VRRGNAARNRRRPVHLVVLPGTGGRIFMIMSTVQAWKPPRFPSPRSAV
jgi:hypothetical protein